MRPHGRQGPLFHPLPLLRIQPDAGDRRDSPDEINRDFTGREAAMNIRFQPKYVTSRHIKERLDKELEKNLALKVQPGPSADSFVVFGRGVLHLSLIHI